MPAKPPVVGFRYKICHICKRESDKVLWECPGCHFLICRSCCCKNGLCIKCNEMELKKANKLNISLGKPGVRIEGCGC